jgi:osmotically-inducible protein OsmY
MEAQKPDPLTCRPRFVLPGGTTAMTIRDEAISGRVRQALAMDSRICGLPIGVRVSHGEVFLKGAVESLDQVNVVHFIVLGIPGVRHVNVDELNVREESDE